MTSGRSIKRIRRIALIEIIFSLLYIMHSLRLRIFCYCLFLLNTTSLLRHGQVFILIQECKNFFFLALLMNTIHKADKTFVSKPKGEKAEKERVRKGCRKDDTKVNRKRK